MNNTSKYYKNYCETMAARYKETIKRIEQNANYKTDLSLQGLAVFYKGMVEAWTHTAERIAKGI